MRHCPATPETFRTLSRGPRREGRQTVQCSADRFDHRVRRAHSSGGQYRAVEYRYGRGLIGSASKHHPREMQSLPRVVQIVEARTDADSIHRQPRHQAENLVKSPLRLDMHDPDLHIWLKPPGRIHTVRRRVRPACPPASRPLARRPAGGTRCGARPPRDARRAARPEVRRRLVLRPGLPRIQSWGDRQHGVVMSESSSV
jgi:hypothetical protein